MVTSDARAADRASDAGPAPAPRGGVRLPRVSRMQLLVVAAFASVFLYYSYIPLFHSDIWGHIAYGRWILERGRLPDEDPFIELAKGVPITDTAWLGQVFYALAERSGGPERVSHLFAVVSLLTSVVLASAAWLSSGRLGVALTAAGLAWLFGFSRHAIVRPENFGGLLFAVLLWIVIRLDSDRARRRGVRPESTSGGSWGWAAIPLLFALWANVHGSFVVGFAVLGCQVLGRAWDVAWSTGRPWAVIRDREFLRWAGRTGLAAAATLANPYGFELLRHTVLFPSNPNLNDVLEWFRLEMVSYEGIQAGFSWIVMMVLFRHSRARISAADVVLLLLLTVATCLRVRMQSWYAPAAALVLVPHLNDVWEQISARSRRGQAWEGWFAAASVRNGLLAGLAVWLAFAFAPVSHGVLGGKGRSAAHLYSRYTPRALTAWLREHPPAGLVFNPQWWGDWLVWDGPPGLRVFITTNAVHVVPARVWKDYLQVARGQGDWQGTLARYGVRRLIAHKELQPQLVRAVRRDAEWQVVYEDPLAIVAERGAPSATEAPRD